MRSQLQQHVSFFSDEMCGNDEKCFNDESFTAREISNIYLWFQCLKRNALSIARRKAFVVENIFRHFHTGFIVIFFSAHVFSEPRF